MEETVTLSRDEYDRLRRIEHEAETMDKLIKNNEPVVMIIKDGWSEEINMRVYSGEEKVRLIISEYSKRLDILEKNNQFIENRYKSNEEKLKKIKEILK